MPAGREGSTLKNTVQDNSTETSPPVSSPVQAAAVRGVLLTAAVLAALSLLAAFTVDARTHPFFLEFSQTAFVLIGREIVTPLGKGDLLIPVLLILAAVGWWRKHPQHKMAGFFGILGFSVSGIFALILKVAVYRPRPFIPDDKTHISSYYQSFPSGDAAAATAVAAILCCFYPRLRWLWISLAALVCLFRVLRLAHWPSDALAGAAFGLLGAAAVFQAIAARGVRQKRKASRAEMLNQKAPVPENRPEGASAVE